MTQQPSHLAALVASRICHDLISPIGAISNGLELLGFASFEPGGPELDLISRSTTNANARIKFFRIAFGLATNTSRLSAKEVCDVLAEYFSESRVSVSWQDTRDLARRDVQLLFLSILCLETVVPYGGNISCEQTDGGWLLTATGDRMKQEDAVWDKMARIAKNPDIDLEDLDVTPSEVEFALLPALAHMADRTPAFSRSPDSAALRL